MNIAPVTALLVSYCIQYQDSPTTKTWNYSQYLFPLVTALVAALFTHIFHKTRNGAERRESNRRLIIDWAKNGRSASMMGVDLMGMNLRGIDLGHNTETGAGIDLRGAILKKCNLDGAVLTRANLEGANMSRASLRGVDFTDSKLIDVDIRKANIDGAKFIGANVYGMIITRRSINPDQLSETEDDSMNHIIIK